MSEGKKSRVTAVGFRHTADGAVEFLGEVSPEDKQRVLEDLQASMSFHAKRRELWGEIGPGAVTRLAKMFPTLRDADGIEPWDAMRFLEWLCGPAPGTGAKWAGLFVLGVWHDLDWSDQAKELPPRRCPDCGGVGRLDRDVGGRVRRGDHDGEFVRDDYDDDGRVIGERVVATDRCSGCRGGGTYVPSLGSDGRFNIYSAFSSWDEEHVAAFHTWTRYPFYP